jgi:hypothetical protein
MKFNFLTEGRRKSDRHQANQRARDTFLGQDAETIRAVGWRKRAQYIMADMGIPDEKQGTIMAALNKVEKKRGATWLNAQPSDALRGTFIQFLNDFKKKDQGLLSLHHARPGVSGIYHMSGAGVGRSGHPARD